MLQTQRRIKLKVRGMERWHMLMQRLNFLREKKMPDIFRLYYSPFLQQSKSYWLIFLLSLTRLLIKSRHFTNITQGFGIPQGLAKTLFHGISSYQRPREFQNPHIWSTFKHLYCWVLGSRYGLSYLSCLSVDVALVFFWSCWGIYLPLWVCFSYFKSPPLISLKFL